MRRYSPTKSPATMLARLAWPLMALSPLFWRWAAIRWRLVKLNPSRWQELQLIQLSPAMGKRLLAAVLPRLNNRSPRLRGSGRGSVSTSLAKWGTSTVTRAKGPLPPVLRRVRSCPMTLCTRMWSPSISKSRGFWPGRWRSSWVALAPPWNFLRRWRLLFCLPLRERSNTSRSSEPARVR
ncbi:hypothetical protein D3C78_782690 [compost metagenome]